jgi:hypothetical protein
MYDVMEQSMFTHSDIVAYDAGQLLSELWAEKRLFVTKPGGSAKVTEDQALSYANGFDEAKYIVRIAKKDEGVYLVCYRPRGQKEDTGL